MTVAAWIMVLLCLVSFNIGFFAQKIFNGVLFCLGGVAGLYVALCEMNRAR